MQRSALVLLMSAPALAAAPQAPTAPLPSILDQHALVCAGQSLWLDLDGDGRDDLYVTAPGADDAVFLQLEDGGLVERTAALGLAGRRSALVLPRPDARAAELLVLDLTGGAELLHRGAGGLFADVSLERGLVLAAPLRSASWIDYDADGAADLWTVAADGALGLARGAAGGRLEPVALDASVGAASGSLRAVLDLPPVVAGPGAATQGLSAGNGLPGSPALTPSAVQQTPSFFSNKVVAREMLDLSGGSNISADRTPTLGRLCPLQAGFITGFHVASETLTAAHLAPDSVGSSELATDSVGALELAPNSVDAVHILKGAVDSYGLLDGSIVNQDVASDAAILGTKITPSFGDQRISADQGARFDDTSAPAGTGVLEVLNSSGQTGGFAGAFGNNDFQGVASADWPGYELGLVGMANDSGTSDNYGVMGHSNGVGVRGENAGNPSSDYGELGGIGIGLRAGGSNFAALLDGVVDITDGGDFNGTTGGHLVLRNQGGTTSMHFDSNEIGTVGTSLSLNADNLSNTRINNLLHVKIDNKVGIGTSLPSQTLDVAGNIECTSLIQTSDARFKLGVEELEHALEAVRALRGVRYRWDREALPHADEGEHLGFLAQEVREVLPQAVIEDDQGNLAVAYTELVPVLVEALKEQDARLARMERALAGER